jgi:hypothetical protein
MADIGDRSTIPLKERRTHPRFKITATVEITDEQSGAIVEARLTNLGLGGCQVETKERFAIGTEVRIFVSREKTNFHARARVVCTAPGETIGLLFTAMEPNQFHIMQTWIETTREAQWLAFHRRRSQRVVMQLPVRVSGYNAQGSQFVEEAVTEIVSAHGALILLNAPVAKGQRLVLTNPRSKASIECAVVYFGHSGADQRRQVGLNFALHSADFWQIRFPPAVPSQR